MKSVADQRRALKESAYQYQRGLERYRMEQTRATINDLAIGAEVWEATIRLRWSKQNVLQQLYINRRTGEFDWRDIEKEESITSEGVERV